MLSNCVVIFVIFSAHRMVCAYDIWSIKASVGRTGVRKENVPSLCSLHLSIIEKCCILHLWFGYDNLNMMKIAGVCMWLAERIHSACLCRCIAQYMFVASMTVRGQPQPFHSTPPLQGTFLPVRYWVLSALLLICPHNVSHKSSLSRSMKKSPGKFILRSCACMLFGLVNGRYWMFSWLIGLV